MKVLVTGATGFLGPRVVAKLAERGHGVTTHGRRESATLRGDLAIEQEARDVLDRGWEAIVNLAGPVTGGTEDLETGIDVVATHVRIALHVRRFAHNAHIVHASSMTVYGLPHARPITEAHRRQPRHLYGLAKMLAEDVLLSDDTLDTYVLRLPGLFSSARRAGALYQFCRATRAGETVCVNAPDPTPWDILHVDDAAAGIVQAVEATGHGRNPINLSYSEPVDLVSIATQIAGFNNVRVEHNEVEHPIVQLDTRMAMNSLGWRPPPLAQRLRELYDAYGAA